MKKRKWMIFPMLMTVFFLCACGSKSAVTAISQETAADYGVAAAPAEIKNESAQTDNQIDGTGGEDTASSLTSKTENTGAFPAGRKLIRNISMNVETNEFETLISSLQARITQLGGYTEQSDMSGNSLNSNGRPDPRYASITARIPVNQIDGFITTVETNGNVTSKSESTQDVTLQYSDLESKKKSLEIEQQKLWEFLEKAESIDTVITLEQRLSDIRYQLESMESQLRLYDNQVDYSTVYLSISEVTTLTPTAPESAGDRIQKGFVNNLMILKNVMSSLLIGILSTIPLWLPMVLAAGALLYFLRKRKKKTPPALPPDEPEKQS
jgi:hypothetical protein